ncbi:hypothetical protein LR48_Vigan10g038100 [Vigna angularis]|uniref:Uncharacterized protein n=1 Tax=Phaseolus angularis TaxID=3914 RepID=A0A0L9VIH9_PHAAN|nr:hypothetical protein LR48_Vigan10g038100 [Vigna angularis]
MTERPRLSIQVDHQDRAARQGRSSRPTDRVSIVTDTLLGGRHKRPSQVDIPGSVILLGGHHKRPPQVQILGRSSCWPAVSSVPPRLTFLGRLSCWVAATSVPPRFTSLVGHPVGRPFRPSLPRLTSSAGHPADRPSRPSFTMSTTRLNTNDSLNPLMKIKEDDRPAWSGKQCLTYENDRPPAGEKASARSIAASSRVRQPAFTVRDHPPVFDKQVVVPYGSPHIRTILAHSILPYSPSMVVFPGRSPSSQDVCPWSST